jgi:protein AroM
MSALPVFIIGQTPRPDLESEIHAAAPGLRVELRGALDGLSREEVGRLRPREDADALFTILPGGETVTISKAAVTDRLCGMLPDSPALLACTGAFKGLPEPNRVIQPSRVLNALAGALLPRGRLGLFVPLPEQVATLSAARRRDAVEVRAVVLRPGSNDAARDAAAAAMADFAPDLAVLDCISYRGADKARIAQRLSCPILLSIAVASRVAASLMAEA